MAFDGNSYYDVPSVSDTPIGSVSILSSNLYLDCIVVSISIPFN